MPNAEGPITFFENEEGKLCCQVGNRVFVDVVPVEYGELPDNTKVELKPPLFISRKDAELDEYLRNPILEKSVIPPSVIDKWHQLRQIQGDKPPFRFDILPKDGEDVSADSLGNTSAVHNFLKQWAELTPASGEVQSSQEKKDE